MSEETEPAVEPVPDAAPEVGAESNPEDEPKLEPEPDPEPDPEPPAPSPKQGGAVTFTYTGPDVHLVGHGNITADQVTVSPTIAAGLTGRDDFTPSQAPKRARKPKTK